MVIKKIATHMKMLISTVGAKIKKKWTSNETVSNLPGRGPKLILPPCTVRRMVRET